MKRYFPFFICSFIILLCSCSKKGSSPNEETLISIQIIDRNGFAETISTSDRLSRYQTTDFKAPQPYQKVLRVFGKNKDNKTRSNITSYHSNGHLWQYLEICDGRAHGIYQEWHFNGNQKMELHIMEGIPELSESALSSWVFEGLNTIWDENGHLIAEIPYERGMLHGDSLYYYPSGSLKKRIPYTQDEIHGDLICYYENQEIAEIIPHTRNKCHGTAKAFFANRTLSYEELFENDLLLTGKYYSDQGTLLSFIESGKGKRSEWEEGVFKRLVTYEKGLPDGLVECFDPQENLKFSFCQKEGKKQGEEWEYYTKNSPEDPLKPKLLLHWQEDMLQGIVKTWFPNGVQESQKELYQNKKNGLFFAWYVNGDLMLSEEYEKDLLTSGTYYKKGDKKPISSVSHGKGTATLYNADGYLLKKVPYEKGLPLLENDSK